MKCPNCGAENPDVAKFCQDCGAKLEAPKPIEPGIPAAFETLVAPATQAQSAPEGKKTIWPTVLVIAAVVCLVAIAYLSTRGNQTQPGNAVNRPATPSPATFEDTFPMAPPASNVAVANKVKLEPTYVLQDAKADRKWRLIAKFTWENCTEGNMSLAQDLVILATQGGRTLEQDKDDSEGFEFITGPGVTVNGTVAFVINSLEEDITLHIANSQGDQAALEYVAPLSEMGATGQSYIEGAFRLAGQNTAPSGSTTTGAKDYMDYIFDNGGYLSDSEKEYICEGIRTADELLGCVIGVYVVDSITGPVTPDQAAKLCWGDMGLRNTDAMLFVNMSEGGSAKLYTSSQTPDDVNGILSDMKNAGNVTLGERIGWGIEGVTAAFFI